MVQKQVNMGSEEPEQRKFKLPSEGINHEFQVVDIIDSNEPNLAIAKLEVVGGEEEGRSLLHRVSLDDQWKGFFTTRLFLKAVGEPYKGKDISIDSDNWIGRCFVASVVHNPGKLSEEDRLAGRKAKVYANIDEYSFDDIKPVDAVLVTKNEGDAPNPEDAVAWDE